MLNPEAVLYQFQQGTIHPTWRVFRGRGTGAFGVVLSGCFATVFSLIFFGICSMFAVIALFSGTVDSPTVQIGAVVLLLALLCGGLVSFLVTKQSAKMRDSVLILTPEGIIECYYVSQPQKRKSKVIDFAFVNSLSLRTTTTHSEHSSSTSFWLDIQYRTGQTERWNIPSQFGRQETTAQYIIEAQALYRAQERLHQQQQAPWPQTQWQQPQWPRD